MAWPKPSSGGVRQWTLALANGLVGRGYHVDVLSEAPRNRFRDDALLDARVGRVVLGKGPAASVRLIAYTRRHPGVRLVAALNHYNLAAAALMPCFHGGTHLTLTQHENLSADAAFKQPLVFRLTSTGVRRFFHKADAVVAVSQGVADDLSDCWNVPRASLKVIYNPAFDPGILAGEGSPAPHPWLAVKTSPVILAAGRLHAVKGFDDLLRAFARVRAQIPARLILLGAGPERERLSALVSELGLGADVVMPGRVSNVAAWMSRSDCFVLSSRREGFGNVLVEALAAGLPIVSTRCPSGPSEILGEGRWGTLVDVGNVETMGAAICDALVRPRPELEVLRARARMFSLDRALDQYLELWNFAR